MATIAELNVRIGAILAPMEKGLLQAEKKLQASGQRLSSIGQDIAISIGLPLAAIGVSAVKAAGDIESLTLALEGQLGSAEKAREELELLRKAALAPGLGFEQAVRGSVQLQAVGLSAEEARRTIEAFGNGLALAGKGGAELDGVITAIGQISSKGKVFAEEINQIAERLPQIRTLMKQAFGTSNTEDIQKLGLSSQEFTAAIVEQLEKLPKATGGIKNAFDNLRDSLNQSLATIGFAINDAFDVTGTLSAFANGVSAIANAFAGLNPTVKAVVLSVGAFLIALGPLVKIFGLLQAVQATYIIGLEGIKKGLLSVSGAALNAATNLRLTLAVVSGGLLIAVTAVAAAAFLLAERFDGATFAAEKFADASKSVREETARETGALNANFAVLLNTNSGYDQRKKAIDTLQAAYPEYLKGIDLEKKSNTELEQIQRRVNASILQGVAERKKASAVNAIYEKQADLLLRIAEIQRGAAVTVSESTLIDTGDLIKNGSRAAAVIEKLKGQVDALGKQAETSAKDFDKAFNLQNNAIDLAAAKQADLRQAMMDREEAELEAAAAGKFLTTTTNAVAEATKKTEAETRKEVSAIEAKNKALIEQSKLLNQNFAPIQQSGGGVVPSENVSNAGTDQVVTPEVSLGAQVEALTAINELLAATGANVVTFAEGYTAAIEGVNASTISFGDAWDQVSEKIKESGTGIEKVVVGALEATGRLASEGGASFADYANAVLDSSRKVIGALIKEAVARAALKALTAPGISLNPFAALALATAAGIAANGIFSGLLGKVRIPALAEGGITTKPTLAMVGDNPGGREAIIPLNKLPGLMQQSGAGMGGIVAEYILRGQDLLTVLKRAEQSNQRLTGAF